MTHELLLTTLVQTRVMGLSSSEDHMIIVTVAHADVGAAAGPVALWPAAQL